MFFFKKPFVAPDNKFVFICGLHRSGTSLLHTILREHPQVSGFANTGVPEDEGQYLQTVYPTIRESGGAGKFCFDPQAPLDERSSLVTEKNRKKLFDQWGKHWDTSKPVLVEKSPCNLIRSRFLRAMFPNSYFIFLVRHPIVVSYATQKWSETSIQELFGHWTKAHRIMRDDMRKISRHILIHYEDLIADPNATLASIYRFLDVPVQTVSEPVYKVLNEPYYDRFQSMREANQNFADECLKFESTFEDHGYLLEPPYFNGRKK
jgi:hypothetical protein